MTSQKTVIVGAGPVGALAALYAARRGEEVHVYDLRGDLRDASTVPLNFTRSINLALSRRGLQSLEQAQCPGLVDEMLADTLPMYGRMVHGKDSRDQPTQQSQAYDVGGRANYAADRGALNKKLLDKLEAYSNVSLHFQHKLVGADFRKNRAWFRRRKEAKANAQGSRSAEEEEIQVDFDFLIGADGAHSATRYHLMKFISLDYQQQYIDTLWCEFRIEPQGSDFALSPNHLHIWPGASHMFIAIPSIDNSFTCTLFAPPTTFAQLGQDPNSAVPKYFTSNFPGVSPALIWEAELVQQFTKNPHLPLISIKCSPYHVTSSAVIVGDAAHAMVPFYGQGMNAGLEDVRVLFEELDAHAVYKGNLSSSSSQTRPSTDTVMQTGVEKSAARAAALAAYTAQRVPDAHAICDLAMANYYEMRAGVVSPTYRVRKAIDELLMRFLPFSGWQSQYSRVSFSLQRYSDVVRAVKRQDRILTGVALGVVLGSLPLLSRLWRSYHR